jgi:hypothetical protein
MAELISGQKVGIANRASLPLIYPINANYGLNFGKLLKILTF